MPQQLPGSLGIHLQSPNSVLFEHKLFPAQTNVRHTAAFVAIMVERNTIRKAKTILKFQDQYFQNLQSICAVLTKSKIGEFLYLFLLQNPCMLVVRANLPNSNLISQTFRNITGALYCTIKYSICKNVL